MRIGCNVLLNELKELDNIGFDYFELGLSDIALMNNNEYENLKKEIKNLKTPVEVFNVLLPGTIKVVGDEYSAQKCSEYLNVALKRAYELGGKLVVFGSGNAKRIPDGFDREKAMQQLYDFVGILADYAEKYDLMIPIEALRSVECNCINNLKEAKELCDKISSDRIVMLADYFHMTEEGDTAKNMQNLGDSLYHVHIAQPKTRTIPYIGDNNDYSDFFNALKSMNYNKRITFEGTGERSTEDCKKYIEFIKENLN